ncbi:uncharacterized protein LOC127148660 [Cucumis melo]|uniref:Uncharacterized protein LOC127148660 n=1 Tax=Cucumis melo TaxID=3656 RepID=A0ABM3KM08_CUCME|nr:uncharacterized protein LOC127148660 [Cucumis melo]
MTDTGDALVGDASKARKRALAELQKVHEAAARERKTIDLDAVRPLNRLAQKNRSAGFNFPSVGSTVNGLNVTGPKIIGLQIEGEAVGGSESGGLKAILSKGLRIERNLNFNYAEIGTSIASESLNEIGPDVTSNDLCQIGPQFVPANLVVHDKIQPNTAPGRLQIEGGHVDGSDFGGLKAESSKGPRIENKVKLNSAVMGPSLASEIQKEIGPKLSGLQIEVILRDVYYGVAFGGSPIQGEMEDFDLAIRDADLVEPQCRETGLLGLGVSPIVSLMRNLHHLKPILRRWFGRHIKSLSEKVRNAKAAMDIAQREVERNPMSDVLSHQAGLATETFWTAVILEEASLRQKSRIRWLKLGDQNTTFFHRSVRSRMSRNTLRSLVDSDGTRVSSHDGVAQMAVNYFSNSLGSQVIGYRELSPFIDDIVQFEWSEECCFFKGAWSVVGEDFCDAVLHFFETCYLPVGVNATTITLIPKHNGAERLKDFRPISCCNVLCKCISKILADRLRVWLPSFISSNQSAFVLGRSIIENILLCQELVGGYHLNSGKPRCTLKVDLQKAYDSVNWDFLFGLLIAIGTPLKFVSWIRACVTSTMFSIMINGSLKGFFHGRKGVRQGDPLSPFLFVMVMEILSRLFANPRKSSIFVAGVNNENASHLAACMGFVRGNLPVRYLGLPLLAGRLCSNDYAPLIHRITSRIRSWTTRVLSFAGRLQLVRFVLRSLQVYWASVFVLPAYVHHEVDKILRSYLWRGKEEGRGGIKVAWVDVCLPFEEGGLGIRDGPSWNIASTLKILWLMLTNSGSLWVAWVEAYILKGRSVWDVDSRVGRSWYLRAILRKREKLKHLVRMKVGNGNSCRVWLDSWLPGGAILEQVGERVMYDAASRREARLSDFIDPDGEWLWPRVSLDLIDLWERVQEVSPCLSVSDSWVWVPGHQGGFSIASAWEAVRPRGGRVLWDGLLWGGGNIPKHSFCAWLAIKDRLGTRDRLHRWDSSVLLSCILCQGGMESRDHLFFSCSFGGDVWSRVLRIMASSHRIGHWGVELFWICHQGIGKGVRRKLWRVLWCATIYFIWNERNHRLHGGQAHDPIVIFHLICSWIRARAGSWREDAHLPF